MVKEGNMKLDVELLKLLLIQAEGEESPDISPYTKEQILYHKNKMLDAGWAIGQPIHGDDKLLAVAIDDLTFAGHQALDVMRNSTAWNRIKTAIQKQGGTLTLAILKTLITQAASGFLP